MNTTTPAPARKTPYFPYTEDAALDVIDRYTVKKQSCKVIADAYGVAKNTVRRFLIFAGIPMDKSATLSAAHKGKPSPQRGRKRSPETCRKIGDAKKGNRYSVGRQYSDETRRKMSESRKRWLARTRIPDQPFRQLKLFTIKRQPVQSIVRPGMPVEEAARRNRQRSIY